MKAGKRATGQELLGAQNIKPQLPRVKQCAAAAAGARLEASSPGAPHARHHAMAAPILVRQSMPFRPRAARYARGRWHTHLQPSSGEALERRRRHQIDHRCFT
eukprot:scaffold22386_cov118-Isochrysis_galbana.AAC.1